MMSPSTCIVFDMDDTLYLERDYVRSGFEAVGRWASENAAIEGLGAAAWRRFESGYRGDIFDRALEDVRYLQGPAIVPELVTVYREHRPNIALATDVASSLTQLQSHARLALITDGFSTCQRNKIEVLGLDTWLDPIIVTDELGEGFRKPHAKAFECIEHHFARAVTRFASRITPERTLRHREPRAGRPFASGARAAYIATWSAPMVWPISRSRD